MVLLYLSDCLSCTAQQAVADKKCIALTHTILWRHVVSALQSWQQWTEEGAITDTQSASGSKVTV